ncbi:uncharacterized protein LOC124440734 [Xenia sp. Carnegie-2017]|uniref:uncharacterized protein LOC124440734 n=1 Tax=Xenia sp. Carnegie-2017 TaxID=2897299 RepID=UPI001F04B1C2|nr:uncharacterized protein LOC124440734 [Xenia sp. Carnegie-2017]XP_046847122.1 uncharacterized protein LOC124440734 [Xenia sp. Carnegie-2017]
MFCPHCGKEKDENANFCENCGASVSEIKPSASSQQPLTFEEYIKKNAVANPCTDRGDQLGNSHRAGSSSTFQTIRKRKSNERFSQIKKKEKKDEVVKIKIGIIELDGKRLKIRRSSLLPVDVRKSDTLVPVKNAGVQKQLAHNRHLRDHNETEWLLLYPDMDIVGNIPGSSEKFSVEKCINELGRHTVE